MRRSCSDEDSAWQIASVPVFDRVNCLVRHNAGDSFGFGHRVACPQGPGPGPASCLFAASKKAVDAINLVS